jgi:hypothetical protein
MLHGDEGQGDRSAAPGTFGARWIPSDIASNRIQVGFSSKEQLLRSCKSLFHEVTGSCGVESAEDESSFHGKLVVVARG